MRPERIVLLPVAALALGCLASQPPAVPLYPGGAAARLPPDQIANLAGPIWKIDGRDVAEQGGSFDLLPGCHLVELTRQIPNDNYSLSGGTYFTGSLPPAAFALRMKPGARYVIRRSLVSDGGGARARVALSAREEGPGARVTDLAPIRSAEDVKACQAWDAARPK